MAKVKIECDPFTERRIESVFAYESERCFFGDGKCKDCYITSNGPDCARCIEENVEWTLTDEEEKE